MASQTAEQINVKTTEETGDGAKKKKSSTGKIFGILTLLILVGGAIVFGFVTISNNLFGARDSLIIYLQRMGEEYQTLEQREAAASLIETQLESRAASLDEQEKRLNELAAELADKELYINSGGYVRTSRALSVFVNDVSDTKLTELKRIGSVYSLMDSKIAASTIANLETKFDMALVIYFMKPQAAADALENMAAALAADIVELVLG